MRPWIAVIIVLAALEAARAQNAAPERIDVQLANTRWQPLTAGIQHVLVAPDGRIVYQRPVFTFPRPTADIIQQHIEAEFNQRSPQFCFYNPVLFEPGGRIWFQDVFDKRLLGYDGKAWITHPLQDLLDPERGRCLTRGGLIDGDANRYVGGTAWFIGRGGVYRYDGSEWSYDQFGYAQPSSNKYLRLAVSADGKRAAAHVNRTPSLWIFADGKWTSHEVLDAEFWLRHLAIDMRNVWLTGLKDDCKHFSIGPTGELTAEEPDALKLVLFGSVRIGAVRSMLQDETGRIFATAEAISDRGAKPQAGVAIRNADDSTRVLRGPELPIDWDGHGYPPPVLTAEGDGLWLTGRFPDKPPALLAFSKAKVMDTLPDVGIHCLRAVAGDGRVFVGRSLNNSRETIMVYSPDAPDLPQLEFTRQEIQGEPVAIAEDGAVWAVDLQKRLIRWTAGQWQVLPSDVKTAPGAILPGHDGIVLVERGDQVVLYRGVEQLAAGGLFEVLEDHHELLARAFAPGIQLQQRGLMLVLASAQDGSLWCLRNKTLRVLAGNRWQDASDVLLKAGSRHVQLEFLAAVGDGRWMYLSDLISDGRSFVGQLKDGKLFLEPAAHAKYDLHSMVGVRDGEGALWIRTDRAIAGQRFGNPNFPPKSATAPTTPAPRADDLFGDPNTARTATAPIFNTSQTALRLKQDGTTEQITNSGWPVLVDEAGNVWLNEVRRKPPNHFKIWRGGQIVQELPIPGYETGGLMFSDRSGSVYAYTAGGLQHLVAIGPDFKQYRLAEVLGISGLAGTPMVRGYSKQGYLVVSAYSDTPKRGYCLYLVKLPEQPG